MRSWLERQWYRLGPAQIFLQPLSWVFACLSYLRRAAYGCGLFRVRKLPVPVIVVGNISVGGTGKTPLVIWLAEFLRSHGYRPAVLSRGYGGKGMQPISVTANSDPFMVGDEPVLIARRATCPVWVGTDRHATGHALLSVRPDCNVLICDDGLQHYALARDVEIAVVDSQRGFGNGQLLPAGPLRESVRRLSSVDVVVSNGGKALPNALAMTLAGRVFRRLANPDQCAAPSEFAGRLLHAVAGIGNPSRFFEHLQGMGLNFQAHPFPDHYPYQPADLNFQAGQAVLMTEKDAVKCAAFAQPDWWYLEVGAEPEPQLGDRVLQALER